MIKLCVFDLDGTLADTLPDLADAMNYALSANNFKTYDNDAYKKFVGDGLLKLIERAAPSANTLTAKKIKQDFDSYYKNHSLDKTSAYPGCNELLHELRDCNIKCAVLSNKPDEFVSDILNTLYPDFKFDKFCGKKDGYNTKPDPAVLNLMIEELATKHDECIFIGDSNVDIYTAKNANVHSCGVLWGFRDENELKSAGADFIAKSPKDILSFVESFHNT